jgi:hypothetical protein
MSKQDNKMAQNPPRAKILALAATCDRWKKIALNMFLLSKYEIRRVLVILAFLLATYGISNMSEELV